MFVANSGDIEHPIPIESEQSFDLQKQRTLSSYFWLIQR